MVFSSVPVYLDPPNWQQQPNHHQTQHPVPPPLPMGGGGGSGSGGGGTGMIRPNSMTERARMAKIPQPEAALKCPRCESTNTKFCYFNNYSLSQPRHFCKTCRRYWTRGGALRNVPVGGGCRRNKRSSKGSSSTRSKPHSVIDHEGQAAADHGARASSSSVLLPASSRCTSDILGHLPNPQQQLLILPTLNHLNDYNFEAIYQAQGGAGFQVANNNGSNSWSILPSGLVDHQWKLQQGQQFPFLSTGLEQAPGLYSFESESVEPQSYNNLIGGLRSKPASLDAEASTQMENVKMEENDQRLNLSSRNFLGINSANDDQYWGSNNINNAWTNLSGFTSSSTTHIL